MPRITLSAQDERVILDALDGYGRHLAVRIRKNLASPLIPEGQEAENARLERDQERAVRLAGVMRKYRMGLGPVEPDAESYVEDDDDNEEMIT